MHKRLQAVKTIYEHLEAGALRETRCEEKIPFEAKKSKMCITNHLEKNLTYVGARPRRNNSHRLTDIHAIRKSWDPGVVRKVLMDGEL